MKVRILSAITALFLILPTPGRAGDDPAAGLTEADRVAIHQVIEAQLLALQHNDGALAFSYASPQIQRMFGTPGNFLEMVKAVYPPVYRPREVQFREMELIDNMPIQKVFFIGPDGKTALGHYLMQKQPDGSWKINGCELTAAPDVRI